MNVLMISGDKDLDTNAPERLALQRSQVERLDVAGYTGIESAVPGFFGVLRLAIRNRYDVITVQEPFWRGLLAWFAARLTCAKLNLQVHADLTGQSLVKRILARFVLRRADSIRVVSGKIKQQIRDIGVHVEIRVLPIFVDLESFKKITPRQHQKKIILWIGRFEPEKAPLYAIYVLQKVLEAGIDSKLIMLGEGSLKEKTEHEGLKRIVRSAGEIFPIEFPGWQNPRSYLEIADVVLCTSLNESWGASIVEARAAGLPVVAPDVGVARQYGAYIAERQDLPAKTIEVLRDGMRKPLDLQLPTAEEWARQWKETLL